jgi:hypothetical protein
MGPSEATDFLEAMSAQLPRQSDSKKSTLGESEVPRRRAQNAA